ncbi:MAG: DUF4153 domain-containing protein [Firmicutes bacterium]|nr:DUF4153 domain-containing protein [Bacillota bacterium]MDD4263726.1 DUF4153 domain-containing protein [Bacillota bacterium]MDD4694370.1 DUF4153 domain-containing protein [Bacillota bacterium]
MLTANLKKLRNSLLGSLKRFPVTVTFTTLLTICLVLQRNFFKPEDVINPILIFQLAVPLTLITKFALERLEKSSKKRTLFYYGLAFLLLLLYSVFWLPKVISETSYYYLEPVSLTRYLAISFALYLVAIATPFIRKRENIELYVIRLLEQFFITIAFAIVLGIGFTAIFGTLEALFAANLYKHIYRDLWILVMGIFAPIHFLAGVPLKTEKLNEISYPKALKLLLLYIIMPLITIYTGILYLYFLKILITLKWPEGIIGNLVLWYGALTTLVTFLVYPLKHKYKWVELFSKWLSGLIIPLILLMFFSVGIRIKAYGVTENRYFVIALGFWVLISMLYFVFKRENRNVLLPLFLALIMMFSVFGPWSAFNIAIKSQNRRFANILQKYEMVKDGEFAKPNTLVALEDQKTINEILLYFNSNHSFSDVDYLPEGFALDDMPELFGFKYRTNYDDTSIFYSRENHLEPIDIEGYDYMFFYYKPGQMNKLGDNVRVEYFSELDRVVIRLDEEEVYAINLKDELVKIMSKNASNTFLPTEEMTLFDENSDVRVKIIFNEFAGRKLDDEDFKITSINLYLLFQVK